MNLGVVVLNPSTNILERLLDVLSDETKTDSYSFPDQELIKDVFQGKWVPLPYIYNALKTMRDPKLHGRIWRDDRVKNIHYILAPKPWDDLEGRGWMKGNGGMKRGWGLMMGFEGTWMEVWETEHFRLGRTALSRGN